jgi:hypothetical protein
MTMDPYDDIRRRTDPSPIDPRRLDTEDRSVAWLPLLLVAALLIGAVLYYFGSTSGPDLNRRADTGITKSEPSPN